MANATIKLAVEMEAPETLRDIIAFLNHCVDAAGPIDVSADARALRDRLDTADARALRDRLDTAVTSGKLRIVPAGTAQEAASTDNQ